MLYFYLRVCPNCLSCKLCYTCGMNIKKAITLAGSQSELARILGITRAAVNHWKAIPPLRIYQLKELRPEWFK
jgi:hypothetical protein